MKKSLIIPVLQCLWVWCGCLHRGWKLSGGGEGINLDLISFLTEDNISMFCYRGQSCSGSVADRLSPAWVFFDLIASGNMAFPLRQTATWGKKTFLTFTHVSKQDDNMHNWLCTRTHSLSACTLCTYFCTHQGRSSNIRERQGRKSDRLTTRIQIAIPHRWSMQQIVSTNSHPAKVTASQGPHHNMLLCLTSR